MANSWCESCARKSQCYTAGIIPICYVPSNDRTADRKIEPTTQTETKNSNLTFEKADERCKGCGHYKLTCDLFSEICKYEPKDEPNKSEIPTGSTISKMEQVGKE